MNSHSLYLVWSLITWMPWPSAVPPTPAIPVMPPVTALLLIDDGGCLGVVRICWINPAAGFVPAAPGICPGAPGTPGIPGAWPDAANPGGAVVGPGKPPGWTG